MNSEQKIRLGVDDMNQKENDAQFFRVVFFVYCHMPDIRSYSALIPVSDAVMFFRRVSAFAAHRTQQSAMTP